MPSRHTRPPLHQIRSLEDLISYGNELDDVHRSALFEYGDMINAYASAHANDAPLTSVTLRALCRAIATGARLSGLFLYNLARVAAIFPHTSRETYADKPWAWFLECVREQDPRAAAERYADMSIGQIKDYRKTREVPREPGYLRLQLTLRPDHVQDLLGGGRVTLDRALPSGEHVRITVDPDTPVASDIAGRLGGRHLR